MSIPLTKLLELYATQCLIRRFEERVSKLYEAGFIPGFIHLCIGQEAVAAGVCAALNQDDFLVSNHRGHGHLLAKGADPTPMLCELAGKATGYCKGYSGSMHVAVPQLGILGANGIVGAGLPIAVGAGLTARHNGRGQVSVAFFGEGATGTGAFHEALNMAAVLRLPVLFVCESNGYAEFTPASVHVPTAHASDRAAAYGIPRAIVDGNDVVACYEAAAEALKEVRGGQPFMLEAETCRWHGHYEGDPQKYRPPDEVAVWQARDPLLRTRRLLTDGGVADAQFQEVEDRISARLDRAEAEARGAPWPRLEDALADVYIPAM